MGALAVSVVILSVAILVGSRAGRRDLSVRIAKGEKRRERDAKLANRANTRNQKKPRLWQTPCHPGRAVGPLKAESRPGQGAGRPEMHFIRIHAADCRTA